MIPVDLRARAGIEDGVAQLPEFGVPTARRRQRGFELASIGGGRFVKLDRLKVLGAVLGMAQLASEDASRFPRFSGLGFRWRCGRDAEDIGANVGRKRGEVADS